MRISLTWVRKRTDGKLELEVTGIEETYKHR